MFSGGSFPLSPPLDETLSGLEKEEEPKQFSTLLYCLNIIVIFQVRKNVIFK